MYLDYENELITDQTQKLKIENNMLKKKENKIKDMESKIEYVYDVLMKLNDYGESKSDEGVTADEYNKMLKSLKEK